MKKSAFVVCVVVGLAGPAYGDNKELSADAQLLTADETQTAYADTRHVGEYYQDGRWYFFKETYYTDGAVSGSGGPRNNKDKWIWDGKWFMQGDQICFDYSNEVTCRYVYKDGDVYKSTESVGGDVLTWWEFGS